MALQRRTPLKAKTGLTRSLMRRKPTRRKPGKVDRAYLALVALLPCAVRNACCGGRITVHHRSGAGMGLRASDFETIPLCERHHLHGPESIEEMGSKEWERFHGVRQAELVERTRALLENAAP